MDQKLEHDGGGTHVKNYAPCTIWYVINVFSRCNIIPLNSKYLSKECDCKMGIMLKCNQRILSITNLPNYNTDYNTIYLYCSIC